MTHGPFGQSVAYLFVPYSFSFFFFFFLFLSLNLCGCDFPLRYSCFFGRMLRVDRPFAAQLVRFVQLLFAWPWRQERASRDLVRQLVLSQASTAPNLSKLELEEVAQFVFAWLGSKGC